MRDVFIRKLTKLAERDSRIMLLTGDLGFSVLDDFAKRFPKQFLNVGVAEQNMTGIATGLALDGRTVFTYSIANFSTLRCLEQIRNDAAYHRANVKVVSVGGGFSYGQLGMSHHATEDLSILRSIPELTVMSPSDKWEVEKSVEALVRTPGAAYLRLDKMAPGRHSNDPDQFTLGTPRILKAGKDLAVVVTGGVMRNVRLALERAEVEIPNCKPTLVSLHTLKPLTPNALKPLFENHERILVIEEHFSEGGLFSALSEAVLQLGLSRIPRFHRIGISGGFCSEVGSQEFLQAKYKLDANGIFSKLMELSQDAHAFT